MFERVATLVDRQMVVTPVTLKPYFEGDEALAELGGTAYLAQLTADGQGLLAARELAQQIYDLALLRELVSVGRDLVEAALDTSEEVEPMKQIETAEARLYDVAEGAASSTEAESFRVATGKALALIETAINSGGHVSGKTTGFTSINDKCGGLHNSGPHHHRRPSGHGQEFARHEHRLQLRPAVDERQERRGRKVGRRGRGAVQPGDVG